LIVRARHLAGVKFELTSGGNEIISDQLPAYGGDGEGVTPPELLLWSIGACFGQAMMHVARRMREPLQDVTLEIRGTKDCQSFRLCEVSIGVSGRTKTGRLEKIASKARKYCFVTNSLTATVHIDISEDSSFVSEDAASTQA
jgi:putative redox protein